MSVETRKPRSSSKKRSQTAGIAKRKSLPPRVKTSSSDLRAARKATPGQSLHRPHRAQPAPTLPPEYLVALRSWNREREALEKAFFYTGITNKTSAELGRYLQVLANARGPSSMAPPPPDFDDNTRRYEQVIRQLLQVKLHEEAQMRSTNWMRWTSFAAVVALLLGVLNVALQINAAAPAAQAPAPLISLASPTSEPSAPTSTLPLTSPIPEPTLSLDLSNTESALTLIPSKPEVSSTIP